jgi:hypothetical protein
MSHPPRRRTVVAADRRPQVELRAVRVARDIDPDADASYLEQEGFKSRLAEYRRGKLHFYEMWIEADVAIEEGATAIVRSTGVGGIESDTTEEELDELITEDWRTLRAALKTMGVPTEQLPLEVLREWIEWRM